MPHLRSRSALVLAGLLAACAAEDAPAPGDDDPVPPAPVALPACASPVARAMWAAMVPVADRGTVSLERMVAADAEVVPRAYVAGPEIFPRMAELIAGARGEIAMQFYKWEVDTDSTETILGGLAAVQERRRAEGDSGPPVKVYLVVDASPLDAGSPPAEQLMPRLVEQIDGYDLDPAHLEITLAIHERKLTNTLGVVHVKSVMVDGRIAMITGANPEAQHDYAAPWHDTGWVLGGSPIAGMLDDFDHSWQRSVRWLCRTGDGYSEECRAPTAPIAHLVLPYEGLAGAMVVCGALLTSRTAAGLPNNDVDNPQDQAMLAAFAAATVELHLETPNLNDDAAKTALLAAAGRGVDVRVILSKGFNDGGESLVGGTNEDTVAELYERLAEAGVAAPCERLQVRWHSYDGVAPVVGNGLYANHTKYTSIDGDVLVFGEMNMDTASWNWSHELNIAVDDGFFTGLVERSFFLPDWARAVPVDQCAAGGVR